MKKSTGNMSLNRARWLAVLLTLVMVCTLSPVPTLAAVGELTQNTGAQNRAILDQLNALYGEDASHVYAALSKLGFLDEKGKLRTDHTIDLDGKDMAVDKVAAILRDPDTDLNRVAKVGGTPIALGDLKTVLEIEGELARIQEKYFKGKSFTPDQLDALNGLIDQVETQGITANFTSGGAVSAGASGAGKSSLAAAGVSPLAISMSAVDVPADIPIVGIGPDEPSSFPVPIQISFPVYREPRYRAVMDLSTLKAGKNYSMSWRFHSAVPENLKADLMIDDSVHAERDKPFTITSGSVVTLDVWWAGEITDGSYDEIRRAFTGESFSAVEFYNPEGFLFKTTRYGDTVSDLWTCPIIVNRTSAFGHNPNRFSWLTSSQIPDELSSIWKIGYKPSDHGGSTNFVWETHYRHADMHRSVMDTAIAIYGKDEEGQGKALLKTEVEDLRFSHQPMKSYNDSLYTHGSLPVMGDWNTGEPFKSRSYSWTNRLFIGLGIPPVITTKNNITDPFNAPPDDAIIPIIPDYGSRRNSDVTDPLTILLDETKIIQEFVYPKETAGETAYVMKYPDIVLNKSRTDGTPDSNIVHPGFSSETVFYTFGPEKLSIVYDERHAPAVESVTIPDGTYGSGQYVPIRITFNQPVHTEDVKVTINGEEMTADALQMGRYTGRLAQAMYKVKEIDGATINVSSITGLEGLLRDTKFSDDHGGEGWNFAGKVVMESARMREAVTGLNLSQDTVTGVTGEAVTVTVDLRQEEAYKTKYADYARENNKEAPFYAEVVGTNGVTERLRLAMVEGPDGTLRAEGTLTQDQSSTDEGDGAMDWRPDVDAVKYGVRIFALETDGDEHVQSVRTIHSVKEFTVGAVKFVDGLEITYSDYINKRLPLGSGLEPTLSTRFVRNQVEYAPTFTTGQWTSSDSDIATVDPGGRVVLQGKLGKVSFTFTANDGGRVDPNTAHVKSATSWEYTVVVGDSPALNIPGAANTIITARGKSTEVRWSTNAKYFTSAAFEFDIVVTEQVSENNWQRVYQVFADRDANSVIIPGEYLTKILEGETPAYQVSVSIPHPLDPEETLRDSAWIRVRPDAPVPHLTLPTGGQYMKDGESGDISWSVENYEAGITEGELVVDRTRTEGGRDITTQVYSEPIATSGGAYTLTPAEVSGLKDIYVVTLKVKNSGAEGYESDSYPLYVYHDGALKLQVNGQDTSGLTMDNEGKVSGTLPVNSSDILQMRKELALLEYVGINYSEYKWSQLKDGIRWETENQDVATINYKQGGLYENVSLFTTDTFLPQTQMALAGLKNGKTTITAIHANTNMASSAQVDVRTLRDKFYMFQFTPAIKTSVTYTDGKGTKKTVETNSEGILPLYEPEKIATDVQLKSTNTKGEVYLGRILHGSLLSGERDGTKLQLYPLNTFRLRQVARVEVFLKKASGNPYTGNVTLRGGVYKNEGYCQDAGMLGNSIPDPGKNPLKDGKASQTVSVGADGKLTVYMDSMDFWSEEKGEEAGDGQKLSPEDNIQYIFELSGLTGHFPVLVYDNGNMTLNEIMRSGGNVLTLEPWTGSPRAFVSNQMMDYKLAGGRLFDVRKSTGFIGPNSTYKNTTLVSTVLGWGSEAKSTDFKVSISDEFGRVPQAQTNQIITYPFSSMPVIINRLNLSEDTITKSGWLEDGADVGLRLRIDEGGAMKSEYPLSPRLMDLTRAPKLNESQDVKAVVLDLEDVSKVESMKGYMNIGGKVLQGLTALINAYYGPSAGITTKMIITPGEDNTEFNAFIWTGYNTLGLDDLDYDEGGVIVEASYLNGLDPSLSMGPSLVDAADMARGKYDAKKNLGEARKDSAEGKGSGSKDLVGQLEGFFDAKIKYDRVNKKWDVFVVDGGFTVGVGATYKYVINYPQMLLTAEFQTGIALQVDFKANLIREQKEGLPWISTITSDYVNDYLITLRLNAFLYAFGGIGFDYSVVALKIGPFGKLSGDFAAKFLSRKYLEKESDRLMVGLGAQIKGEVGVKFVAQFLFVTKEVIIGAVGLGSQYAWREWTDIAEYWNENWQSGGGKRMLNAFAVEASEAGLAPVSATNTLESRDYLEKFPRAWASPWAPTPASASLWTAPNTRVRSLDPVNGLEALQTNAYPYSFPVVTEDGALLLHAFDSDSKDVFDTRIYATKLTNGVWPQGDKIAAPGAFEGNGDSGHALAGNERFAAAGWIRQDTILDNKEAGDPVSPAEEALMMNGTEIVAAIYDGSDWTSTRLTNNALPDMAPVVATNGSDKAMVAWRSVYAPDSTNLLDFSAQDYIMYSLYENGSWSAAKRLYSGTAGMVRGLTAAMLPDGTAAVAYSLDRTGEGDAAHYEIGYAMVDSVGDPARSLVVTRDDWLNQNPQLTVAKVETEPQFVLGWHSMRDQLSDIRLVAIDGNGNLSNTFPDSIAAASGGADVVIDGNFRFTKMGGTANDISNLSIVWPQVVTDADGDPERGVLRAIKFSRDGRRVSSALEVAELPWHVFANHFEAYGTGGEGTGVKAVVQGTLYHDIDPDDPDTYASYTGEEMTDDTGTAAAIIIPREETSLYTATEIYENKAKVTGITVDYATLSLNARTPIQFSLLNAGMDPLDSATVKLGGQITTFRGIDLAPNEETMLTCWYTVGDQIENLPYEVTAGFGDAQETVTGTVYLDYPNLGISQMKTVAEDGGKRTVRLTLYNSAAATLSGGKDRTVNLGFYEDASYEKILEVSSATDGVSVNSDQTLSISGEAALALIDEGALALEVTFDVKGYLPAGAEIPESGIPFYGKVWITETKEGVTSEMPEYFQSDNGAFTTFESLLSRTGEPVSIFIEQRVTEDGKTVADVTVKNNALRQKASGNLILTLLDEKGDVIQKKQTYTDLGDMILLDGEESKTLSFTFDQGGSRVTAIYGELVLAEDNANLAALSFEGIAATLTDFTKNANGDYTFTAPDTEIPSTIVQFVTESPNATVSINGKPASTGQNVVIPGNKSTITVAVTSADGQTVQKYILGVSRAKTITVGPQTGKLVKGVAGGSTYEVTTTKIASGSGIVLDNISSVAGISLDTEAITGDTTIITVRTTAETPEGVHPLALTIDGIRSADFELLVEVDDTPPTGTIAIGASHWSSFSDSVPFRLFSRDPQTVSIGAVDNSGHPVAIEYFLAGEAMTAAEADALPENYWYSYTDPLDLSPAGRYIVYARLTDSIGNRTLLNSEGIVLYSNSRQDTSEMHYITGTNIDQAAAVRLNGNTVAEVKNGADLLVRNRDYTVSWDTITFKASYLESLAMTGSPYTLTVSYHPLGVAYPENPIAGSEPPAVTTIDLWVREALPSINSVQVLPEEAEVQKGDVQVFAAIVVGQNDPPQTVTWAVEGANCTGTGMIAEGALLIDPDETATTITVHAISTVDTTKSGTATVTVTDSPPAPTWGIFLSSRGLVRFPAVTEGYVTHTALSVDVINLGNQPTGDLEITLSGAGADAFQLSVTTLAGIHMTGRDSFIVAPKEGLPAGDYLATVSVSGDNGIAETFDVTFHVNEGLPVTWPLTVVDGTGSGDYAAGDVATITANAPPAGKIFDRWTGGNGGTFGSVTTVSTTFTMPANAATVTAIYKDDDTPAPTWIIELSRTGIHRFPAQEEGYEAQTPLTTIVTNLGNQPTGELTVALSGADAGSFELSETTLAGILVSGSDSFTVAPKTGLSAGSYTATITVSGDHGLSETFGVSFNVNEAPTWAMELNRSGTYVFPAAAAGYEAQTPLSATVTNTGNQPTGDLEIALSGADADSFTLSTATLGSIAAGGDDSFTVVPDTGLAPGDYAATITVSGDHSLSGTFKVSFHVGEAQPVTWPLTVVDGTGSGDYAAGEAVNIAAGAAPAGKVFDRWTGGNGGTFASEAAISTTFTMPANAATVTAIYKDDDTPAPIWGMELNRSGTCVFPAAAAGYGAQAPLSATVTNTGNQPTGELTIALSGADADSFTLSTATLGSIAAGGNDSFTVVPDTGLAAGDYTATITVSGDHSLSGTFNVSFHVGAAQPVTWPLTVIYGTGSGDYAAGEAVNIIADAAPAGKVFDRWTGGDGGTFANETAVSTTFTMPANAATVTAIYRDEAATPIPVSSITISGPNTITTKGGIINLTATFAPANATTKAALWTSGDPNVATVDADGKVTAKANGTVTIRATAQDGSGVYGEIIITVTGQTTTVTTLEVYDVLDHFGTWNGTGTAIARVNADDTKFVNLTRNGTEIDPKHYTVTAGSTVITLKESYLKTLSNGKHTFVANFSDGYSEAITLTVSKTVASTGNDTDDDDQNTGGSSSGNGNQTTGKGNSPTTGATANIQLWISILILSAAGIILCLLYAIRWRKRNAKAEMERSMSQRRP